MTTSRPRGARTMLRGGARRVIVLGSVISLLLLGAGCSGEDKAPPQPTVDTTLTSIGDSPEWRVSGHEPVAGVSPLPYEPTYVREVQPGEVDRNGVMVVRVKGQRTVHPVTMAQFATAMLSNFRLTKAEKYLDLARANAEVIIERATKSNGAYWYDYDFDFALHGDPQNTIHAPWWSAMAQGQVLSLMVRLYRADRDPKWLEAADRTFAAMVQVRRASELPDELWCTFVGDNQWLWLEEYAGDSLPMRVLNGHIFAMYGLYDYWSETKDERAAVLFDGAATTVLNFVPKLRNKGRPSWYGMRVQDNPRAMSEKYHRIHVDQLAMLAEMTEDPEFTRLSDLLRGDFY